MITAALVLAGVLSADGKVWSPYDHFFQPDTSCEVRAALPGPGGSTLLGGTCNRLDGRPIGPLVLVDAKGQAVDSPLAKALLASVPDDRMLELSQLVAYRDGWVVTRFSREKGKPHYQGVNFPAGHQLLRLDGKGARDEAFGAAVKAALDERLGQTWGILDVSTDKQGRLIVAATAAGDTAPYLKKTPVRLLGFDAAGKVVAEVKLEQVLAGMGLGYYEVLAVRARPDGGLFVGGRFQRQGNAYDRLFLLAFDKAWKPDAAFNDAFRKAYFNQGGALEIRLLVPDEKGGVWAIGEYQGSHVVRVGSNGLIDPAVHLYKMPGTYPQGRFLKPSLAALAADGGLWLGFGMLPGKSKWAPPGFVRLKPDGTPDDAFAKAVGQGLWSERMKKEPDPDAAGWETLLAPMPDGAVVVAGSFDHFGDASVSSPIRLTAAGKLDAAWAPKLSTEVPKKQEEPNATTSAYFKADGKEHYIACKLGGRTETFIYMLQDDSWGHKPSCAVHLSGDMASPAGPWQSCDAQAKALEAKGAKCKETKHNPLDIE